MKIYAFIPILVLLIACPAEAKRTNIILIISDDQHWTEFGFMGHPIIQTPTIDRLAHGGTVFTDGVNSASLCQPSLRTLLTGLYPQEWERRIARLAERGIEFEPWEEIRAFETLPRILARRGYVSFQAGKYWEGTYADAGFTDGMTDLYLPDGNIPGITGNAGLALVRNGIDPVLDFIDANQNRPFFIWFAPMVPHIPHTAPQEYEDLYAGLGLPQVVVDYYGMISLLDAEIAHLLDYLERRGLSDDTLIVFLVDNGWIQPETEWPIGWRNGLGGARGKGSPNEPGFRTPIIFYCPGRIEAGRIDDRLITTADVWQLIVRGNRLKYPRLSTSFAVSLPFWDLYVTKQWWAIWPQVGPARLYYRPNDPDQTNDLAGMLPELMQGLRAEWQAKMQWPPRRRKSL